MIAKYYLILLSIYRRFSEEYRDEKGEFLQKYLLSIAIENEKQENYYIEKN